MPAPKPELTLNENWWAGTIVETSVSGVLAYHATCSCGWESRRFNKERSAVGASERHAETHGPAVPLEAQKGRS
jgi:hypothetical protein